MKKSKLNNIFWHSLGEAMIDESRRSEAINLAKKRSGNSYHLSNSDIRQAEREIENQEIFAEIITSLLTPQVVIALVIIFLLSIII